MKKEEVKKASVEIVDALTCILDAQLGERPKQNCVPVIMKPVHRFCKIARDTEKRVQAEERREGRNLPERYRYEISHFLGFEASARQKMGIVCSSQTEFPACQEVVAKSHYEGGYTWDDYLKALPLCAREVQNAIKTRPIEKSSGFEKLLTSFETMRDWMHVSGYTLPDYVWNVPYNMRGKTKRLFEFLSSSDVRSSADLKRKREEIKNW